LAVFVARLKDHFAVPPTRREWAWAVDHDLKSVRHYRRGILTAQEVAANIRAEMRRHGTVA
jgi:hypothetical protein